MLFVGEIILHKYKKEKLVLTFMKAIALLTN